MFSQIHPQHYISQDIFNQERSKIFRHNWIFVGFKSDVANHNDFITTKIGGIPIVVQNFNGTIKAFINICSHRFSILQSEDRGNRPLVCPYHAWAYDKSGKPCGIPKKPLFTPFTKDEIELLKLREYSIEFCGDMIFVSINKPAESLEQFLGTFYMELEKISNSKSKKVDTNILQIKSNWKIIVENTLESYHVGPVHANTFDRLGTSGLNFTFEGVHSKWETNLGLSESDKSLSRVHKNFEERDFKIDGYVHYLVYPNLLISSTYGISYNYSTIEPIDASTTKFTSQVYLSPSSQNSVVDHYGESLAEFNRKVFDEDKVVCELAQQGAEYTDKPGILSLEEKRVHNFQKNYIKNYEQWQK